jgi:hypothetical protein
VSVNLRRATTMAIAKLWLDGHSRNCEGSPGVRVIAATHGLIAIVHRVGVNTVPHAQ